MFWIRPVPRRLGRPQEARTSPGLVSHPHHRHLVKGTDPGRPRDGVWKAQTCVRLRSRGRGLTRSGSRPSAVSSPSAYGQQGEAVSTLGRRPPGPLKGGERPGASETAASRGGGPEDTDPGEKQDGRCKGAAPWGGALGPPSCRRPSVQDPQTSRRPPKPARPPPAGAVPGAAGKRRLGSDSRPEARRPGPAHRVGQPLQSCCLCWWEASRPFPHSVPAAPS